MNITSISLDDKYVLDSGRVYLTGTQALVRLPIMQQKRDQAAGLKTSGFISGYRGSPLGGLDQQLQEAQPFLDRHSIHFQPGVNEDLAATAIWGTQQVGLAGDALVDGVFALWYGKGPGVDRTGDVFRHGNMMGTAPKGGVLVLAGDDHTCKSSVIAHQTEYAFVDAMIPVLSPSGVQEFLDLGLFGWALSRWSGCWVAMKAVAETVETSASVSVDADRVKITLPEDFPFPPNGLSIRWPDLPMEQEYRLHHHKIQAVLAFIRANRLNNTIFTSKRPWLGIVTHGKSYLDVRQAMDDLGIRVDMAQEIGLALYKIGVTWPLEPEGIRDFSQGLDEILVIEEKRALVESQIKEHLYNGSADARPRIVGKYDEKGEALLPSNGALTSAMIARVIVARLRQKPHLNPDILRIIEERLAFLQECEQNLSQNDNATTRTPYFCSGCPHNTSTRIPEGSRAIAGIGCHYMAIWMDRNTQTVCQMGGEGASWIGQHLFVSTPHIFANLGDGTYYHSGILAIRAAVAAKIPITYKILFNDAVAMTGGQAHDGPLNVSMIAQQVAAEGVKRIALVSDDPDKYPLGTVFPKGMSLHHRDALDDLQRELRTFDMVSVLIYDQTCAAEKRRWRKRGILPDPEQRLFINQAVCEGCGDCSDQSNCLSIVPIETEFGRKRMIDQSSCNKDFSCVNGFCPSFVTVHGGRLRRSAAKDPGDHLADLPSPTLPCLEDQPYNIIITGIGGTGVVTIGALIGMAAHLDGLGCSVLGIAGLAQKGGAVTSHIRLARTAEEIHAVCVAAGGAKLLLGCDIIVSANHTTLTRLAPGRTKAVINTHATITAEFVSNPDYSIPVVAFKRTLAEAIGGGEHLDEFDATRLATQLMGDSLYTNLLMIGFAWQRGFLPISLAALEQAIQVNGRTIVANLRAFSWGRLAAVDMAAVELAANFKQAEEQNNVDLLVDNAIEGFTQKLARREVELTAYQDAAYAQHYKKLVETARQAEQSQVPGRTGFAESVAHYSFKLMAIKDEYEIGRLYSDGRFKRQLAAQFEGTYRLEFHLAPPLLSRPEQPGGRPPKKRFGSWMMIFFHILARFRWMRGQWFDPFHYQAERRLERQILADYLGLIKRLSSELNPDNYDLAIELAQLPEQIRGYGPVKQHHIERFQTRYSVLLEKWNRREWSNPKIAAE